MSILNNFPHDCTLLRKTISRGTLGASLEADVTISTGITCWVQNASSTDVLAFQKRDQQITHKVFLLADPGLRPEDVLVPSNGPFAGKRLIVRASTERSVGLSIIWAAFCEEQNNAQPTTFN